MQAGGKCALGVTREANAYHDITYNALRFYCNLNVRVRVRGTTRGVSSKSSYRGLPAGTHAHGSIELLRTQEDLLSCLNQSGRFSKN
jgi:hypothetical protein